MNIFIIEIFIPNGVTRHIVLHDGIDGLELNNLFKSCFAGHEIIGLQNNEGVVYPLSMILRNPSNFGNMKFAAIVRNIQEEQTANPKSFDIIDWQSGSGIKNEKSISVNKSLLKVTNSALLRPDPTADLIFSTTIAEAKDVLGLGQFSAEFVIEFLIGVIADGDDDESSWLISKAQFDSAISQLAYRQYLKLSSEQQKLSDFIVRSMFTIFDEESSGYCDLRELGCGLMLFAGGEIIDRAQMAYKLVAESHDSEGYSINDYGQEDGVSIDMMTVAMASVLKVVAILNNSYLNSCDPITTAEEITKRAFIRAKLSLLSDSTISQEDFEYWFSVVLTIYNEIEEEDDDDDEEGTEVENITDTVILPKKAVVNYYPANNLSIDTDSALYDADLDIENGDVRTTMPPNPVVLELQRAKYLLGLTGVPAEDLMELLGQVSSDGVLSAVTWEEYLSEFVVGDKNDKKLGTELGMKLFRAFDKNDDETVSYIDFCAGLSLLSDSPIEDKIMVAFVLNDTESVGMITVPELENLILGSLRVVVACSALAATRMKTSGVSLENLSHLTVMEGLAVMELTYDDALTLETVSEIALKCVALSAN